MEDQIIYENFMSMKEMKNTLDDGYIIEDGNGVEVYIDLNDKNFGPYVVTFAGNKSVLCAAWKDYNKFHIKGKKQVLNRNKLMRTVLDMIQRGDKFFVKKIYDKKWKLPCNLAYDARPEEYVYTYINREGSPIGPTISFVDKEK